MVVTVSRGIRAPFEKNVYPQNKAAKRKLVLELISKGASDTEACRQVKMSHRTLRKWRQEDEEFRGAYKEALDASTDRLRDGFVNRFEQGIMDPSDRMAPIIGMFLLKQRDPSYRDNAKIEHVAGKGLMASLRKLAELGVDG